MEESGWPGLLPVGFRPGCRPGLRQARAYYRQVWPTGRPVGLAYRQARRPGLQAGPAYMQARRPGIQAVP